MIHRIRLSERQLPSYSYGEELTNTLTHGLGAVLAAAALALCVVKAARLGSAMEIAAAAVYGGCMIALYCVSSVYHGLRPGMAKKVMQVIDHCTIYLLIAGSYTVIGLTALRRMSPVLGWGMVVFQWALAAVAITLTAIDLKAFRVFSMICYIGMGWAIVPFVSLTRVALGSVGFGLLLAGGISFTIGAVLYGIGSKVRWMHSVFHVFVVLGSVLQFFSIYLYAIG